MDPSVLSPRRGAGSGQWLTSVYPLRNSPDRHPDPERNNRREVTLSICRS